MYSCNPHITTQLKKKERRFTLDVVHSSVRDVGSFERLVRFDSSAGIP